MKDIIPAKKESPILGLSGLGGGVGSNIVAGLDAERYYVDDVFKPQYYKGTGGAQSITTGVDLADKGGLVWCKSLDYGYNHILTDTVRGVGRSLGSNITNGELSGGPYAQRVTAFNANGFSLGNDNGINHSGGKYISWTFAKHKGFFDVKTFTGHSSNFITVNHDLECEPGLIAYKRTDSSGDWYVWQHNMHENANMKWNSANDKDEAQGFISSQNSTSARFYVNTSTSATYVAYFFAGADQEGNASIRFDGTDGFSTATSSYYTIGTNVYTLEFWVKWHDITSPNNIQVLIDQRGSSTDAAGIIAKDSDHKIYFQNGPNDSKLKGTTVCANDTWYHVAMTRDSSNRQSLWINGTEEAYRTFSTSIGGNHFEFGGAVHQGANQWTCKAYLSNFRYMKDKCIYTSAFTPPTSPLTLSGSGFTHSDVQMLALNDQDWRSYTKMRINSWDNGQMDRVWYGNPTGSSESPFSSGFSDTNYIFGKDGDQSIIRSGIYEGNGSGSMTAGPEIHIGWQPQYIFFKSTTSNYSWRLYDTKRGIRDGYDTDGYTYDKRVDIESSTTESSNEKFKLTPNGFKITTSSGANDINGNGEFIMWMAIRGSDGHVGKPAEAGTDVFSMDLGNSSTSTLVPAFDATHDVDFRILKQFGSNYSWYLGDRLRGQRQFYSDTTSVEVTGTYTDTSYNNGEGNTWSNSIQAWMWKRHAGFDIVTYRGNGQQNRELKHGLGQTPEMIWVKGRNSAYDWVAWHKDLFNGAPGSIPYFMHLNKFDDQSANSDIFGGTANIYPTSDTWTIGSNARINQSGTNQIAYLFASVTGVSKLGNYWGSSNTQTITTGFQPRFIMIKGVNTGNGDWMVVDSLQGLASGSDPYLRLNNSAAQGTLDIADPLSTGFQLNGISNDTNASGKKYIYYAHA